MVYVVSLEGVILVIKRDAWKNIEYIGDLSYQVFSFMVKI